MSRWHACGRHARGAGTWWQPPQRSSGNRAFDEYRTETLRRLEEEQREFHDFLDRLRMAKDKSEFDQFMAERRNRPSPRSAISAAELSTRFCDDPPAVFPDTAGGSFPLDAVGPGCAFRWPGASRSIDSPHARMRAKIA